MKEILLHFECSFHLEQTMQIDILIILEETKIHIMNVTLKNLAHLSKVM